MPSPMVLILSGAKRSRRTHGPPCSFTHSLAREPCDLVMERVGDALRVAGGGRDERRRVDRLAEPHADRMAAGREALVVRQGLEAAVDRDRDDRDMMPLDQHADAGL